MIDPNTIQIDTASDLIQTEAEQLIGKTITAIDAGEFAVQITFSDGTVLETKSGYEGSVSVTVDWPDKPKPVRRDPNAELMEQMQRQMAAAQSPRLTDLFPDGLYWGAHEPQNMPRGGR